MNIQVCVPFYSFYLTMCMLIFMKTRKKLLKFQPVLFQTHCSIADFLYVSHFLITLTTGDQTGTPTRQAFNSIVCPLNITSLSAVCTREGTEELPVTHAICHPIALLHPRDSSQPVWRSHRDSMWGSAGSAFSL